MYVSQIVVEEVSQSSPFPFSLMDDLSALHPSSVTSTLFTGEEEVFAFRRTVSRMYELQTAEYWASAGPSARQS